MGAVEPVGVLVRGLPRLLAAAAVAGGLAASVAGWRYWHDTAAALATVRPLAPVRAEANADLFRAIEGEERGVPIPEPLDLVRRPPRTIALPAAAAPPVSARRQVLGVPFLPFAPVGRAVMRHVADLGETLGAPVAGPTEAVR